jgi:hypothetical protein
MDEVIAVYSENCEYRRNMRECSISRTGNTSAKIVFLCYTVFEEFYINVSFFFQNLKNQIMTTNVWVEQVCTK